MTGPGEPAGWSPGQVLAHEQLERIRDGSDGALTIDWVDGLDRSGWLGVRLSLDCAGIDQGPEGLALYAREPVKVLIPKDFPFRRPDAEVPHWRFAGTPHVQWGRHICLYASSGDWLPHDGMYGLVDRLADWYERAAVGRFEAPGEPLHPPVAYGTPEAGCVVVHADAPRATGGSPWLGLALLRHGGPARVDLRAWLELDDPLAAGNDVEGLARLAPVADGWPAGGMLLAPVVVLPGPMAFEFPTSAGELLDALSAQEVPRTRLTDLLGAVAEANRRLAGGADGEPLAPGSTYVLVGAPMRGIAGRAQRITHLAAWLLPDEAMAEGTLGSGPVAWATVYEQRPELTVRRDATSPSGWLRDQRVLVLGCGALGAPVAEWCVRAGAAEMTLVDRAGVHPGLLVRQPYEDHDIGWAKATRLAARLQMIRPDVRLEPIIGDAIDLLVDDNARAAAVDLVVDATANQAVAARLEWCRWATGGSWPPILTLGIGHDAQRGVAALTLPGASGGGADILRRLGLAARQDTTGALADVADDLFPESPRTEVFQPEPGCSDATFVGSAPEVAALAGHLFAGALATLAAHADGCVVEPMSAFVARLGARLDAPTLPAGRLGWPNDVAVPEQGDGYQVRIAEPALRRMRAEARLVTRLGDNGMETGGVLLGQIDDACRVVWVSAVTGPPPDSELSPHHFKLGTQGVAEYLAGQEAASGGSLRFVGTWHTHPGAPHAMPSRDDDTAMSELVSPVEPAPHRALLLILAGAPRRWSTWLSGIGTPELFARLERHDTGVPSQS